MGWLSWRWGIGGAVVALAMWPFLKGLPRSMAREFGIVSFLYGIWNLGGRIEAFGADQAFERGEQIWRFQQRIGLPSEAWMQELILPFPWLVKSANVFYALVHVPAMIATLIWMFFYHRSHYASFRTQLALFTGTSLIIQLIAVAPPRFVELTEMTDTGILYGQSVYAAIGRASIGQLQAMPSIHVGWAFFVGALTYRFATHGWLKWLGVAHAVITMWVVMVTANHYWMDGIVAGVIMVFWYAVLRAGRRVYPRRSSASDEETPRADAPSAALG